MLSSSNARLDEWPSFWINSDIISNDCDELLFDNFLKQLLELDSDPTTEVTKSF